MMPSGIWTHEKHPCGEEADRKILIKGEMNMLDLGKLSRQIMEMVRRRQEDIEDYRDKGREALEALRGYDEDPSAWMARIDSDEHHFFVAFPQGKMQMAYPLPEEVGAHTVMAVDGSQIEVDTHEITLCYIINIGRVVLHYGTGDKPLLDSVPTLFYKEEDLYREKNGESLLVQGDALTEVRSYMEGKALEELLDTKRIPSIPAVVLADGSLVSWDKSASAKKDIGGFTSPHFEGVFRKAEGLGIPVAGYISGSRSSLVIHTLRAKDCTQQVMNCSICPYRLDRQAPCRRLDGIRDTLLFENILKPGERSTVFYGGINSLERKDWPKYRIGFFFVHVGQEIARVEAPDYVLERKELLDLLHRVVYDQAQKGMGYPIALKEAHHFAVDKGAERDLFFDLVEKQFGRAGVPSAVTPKKLRKQTRIF